jgi:hypothetical protein
MAQLSYQIPLVVDSREQFASIGMPNWHSYLVPPPSYAHFEYVQPPLVNDMNDGPFLSIGCLTMPCGHTALPYWILPPIIQWSNHPLVPPPMQYSTRDGSLVGAVDGRNATFTATVNFGRVQVFVNGMAQTLDVDCCAPSGQSFIRFLPDSVPQPGDVVTVEMWTNL